MTRRPIYMGEITGNNLQVSPVQLIDMIQRDIESGSINEGLPIKGMFVVLVSEDEDGVLHLDNYRCGLPKFVEIAVMHRTFQRVSGSAIQD